MKIVNGKIVVDPAELRPPILQSVAPKAKKWIHDVGERVFWTAVEAGVSTVSVTSLGLPEWLIPPAAAGLAVVKGFIAKHVGDNSAALTPIKGE